MHAAGLIQKQYKAKKIYGNEMVDYEPVNDSFLNLRGTILGPPETPYVGGVFHLSIDIPDEFPFKPPKIKFITKIYHP